MKKFQLLTGILMLFTSAISFGQNARIQVIHNSPDAAANMVDIYLNSTLLLDDFTFRTASPFIDAPAGTQFTIGVAPANSTMSSQAIVTVPLTLTAGETYVAIANGIVSPSGYSPATAFSLDVYNMGRETANIAGNTDVLVFHGSTDAPTVDVVESTAGNVVNNASYGDFAGYLELPTADYTLNVQDQNNTTTVAAYQAPLSTLGLTDNALVVVASGFLNPAVNSNGPAFGLWVALAAGGALIPLPTTSGLGVDENNLIQLQLYPNPAQNTLKVSGSSFDDASFIITDIAGKVILTGKTKEGDIDVSNLTAGRYFVSVPNAQTASFVKK